MKINIALAGNPNCGKTTMFNNLTGATQYVGNWPGVTVEKKEGSYTKDKNITITDLPGIYSLSPYSPEEIVARDYLLEGGPDVVINLVDATNLERNLYLTTQILDLGVPVVIALNMMDLVRKANDKIDIAKLSARLGCPIVETSALKGEGMQALIEAAITTAKDHLIPEAHLPFDAAVESSLKKIEGILGSQVSATKARWFAIKLFENEDRSIASLNLSDTELCQIDTVRDELENAFDDDAESIIAAERYDAIMHLVDATVKRSGKDMTLTQKIDRVVTNRWLSLPIFVVIMALVYYLAISIGVGPVTDWANDGISGDGWLYTGRASYEEALGAWEEDVDLAQESGAGEEELALLEDAEPDPSDFGLWIPGVGAVVGTALEAADVAPWLQSLIIDGVIAGVGAVIGFIPQMIILFFLLALLEECGYLARVAFIMDRIFRRFGLSGKSFIPMLVASGCGVPAVMATKTIESERDRRMTIMTTTMIPCSAKMPIIALVFGALAGGNTEDTWWVAPLFYFLGVIAIIISGIMLKKTKMFAGEAAPFVMELPAYHMPTAKSVFMSVWERIKSYVVKAGTIIFLSTVVIWFLMNFGNAGSGFGLLDPSIDDYVQYSLMAGLGNLISWIFAPLGFGDWQAVVTSITGLVAKENVVATVSILSNLGEAGEADPVMWIAFANMMGGSVAAILSFCAFNLLCAPCFAAVGTIRRQMESSKWTWFAVGYMTVFAWCVGLMFNQFGGLLTGALSFSAWTVVALVVLALILFQLFRPMPHFEKEDRVVLDTPEAECHAG